MTMYDKLLPFAVAIALFYGIQLIVQHVKKRKNRKSMPQKNTVSKAAMLRQYSDQRLRLNMMALEAAREMSVAAAKNPLGQKRS